MIKENEITAVGKLQKTHALGGEMNLLLDIDPEYLEAKNPAIIEIDGIYVPFYAENVRPKGHFSYLVKFEGIDSEIEAKRFVNKDVYALRERLKEFIQEETEDEFALFDELLGWTVSDSTRGEIGKIIDIDNNTENQLFIVESLDGKVVYIPIAEDLIDEIDRNTKEIRMSLPEGILDLN